MKLLQLLDRVPEYQPVTITPDCDLDWNNENPYVLDPEKVSDLRWFFIKSVGDREVTSIQAASKEGDGFCVAYLSISYR